MKKKISTLETNYLSCSPQKVKHLERGHQNLKQEKTSTICSPRFTQKSRQDFNSSKDNEHVICSGCHFLCQYLSYSTCFKHEARTGDNSASANQKQQQFDSFLISCFLNARRNCLKKNFKSKSYKPESGKSG